ncbi:hypothetical protein [Peptacetobacter sp. AB845]|uniref:hypothetical protein n=1 Tax=Peptacetobacter sp. AB845 TaxID=3388429 RepID=UPI0039C938C8
MNLKQEITKTENLETKLKKGITNINNIVVRGGVQSTSVAEVPDNITKMLGQYKKIAIIKPNKTLQFLSTFGETDFVIDTNLNFNPSLIILVLQGDAFKKK